MKNWTPDASERFESWLGSVKRSVAGDPAIDADDVAQDLRAHVHAELESQPGPVTVTSLDQVLAGLGHPSQWTEGTAVAAGPGLRSRFNVNVGEVVTDWQKALAGEWGLPILLAGLTLFALPFFDDGGIFIIGLTYFIARAQVIHAPHRLVGRQKWLVYFPLAIGAGLLAGLVIAFPIVMGVGRLLYQPLGMLGGWWVALGFMAAREPKRVQSALRPFADSFEPAHGRFLMTIGGALLIVAFVMLVGD